MQKVEISDFKEVMPKVGEVFTIAKVFRAKLIQGAGMCFIVEIIGEERLFYVNGVLADNIDTTAPLEAVEKIESPSGRISWTNETLIRLIYLREVFKYKWSRITTEMGFGEEDIDRVCAAYNSLRRRDPDKFLVLQGYAHKISATVKVEEVEEIEEIYKNQV